MTPSQTQGSDEHQGMNMKYNRIESQIKQALNMNTAQTQALKKVKNEVSMKHFNRDFPYQEGSEMNTIVNEIAELYHTRLLAEAGEDISEDKIRDILSDAEYKTMDGIDYGVVAANIREYFSTLLAAKQAEVDRLTAELKAVSGDYTRLQQEGN